jgi:hypothetical protein
MPSPSFGRLGVAWVWGLVPMEPWRRNCMLVELRILGAISIRIACGSGSPDSSGRARSTTPWSAPSVPELSGKELAEYLRIVVKKCVSTTLSIPEDEVDETVALPIYPTPGRSALPDDAL